MPNSEEIIYTVLINKNKLFSQTLSIFLPQKFPAISILGSYQDSTSAYSLIESKRIDLLILDASLETDSTENVIADFKKRHPDLYVIVLAEQTDSEKVASLSHSGADKIVYNHLKSASFELLMTISIMMK